MVKIISTLATELEWKVWTSIDGLLTLRFYFPVASERILELQCVAFIPQLLRCFNKKTAQKGYLQEETYIYIYIHTYEDYERLLRVSFFGTRGNPSHHCKSTILYLKNIKKEMKSLIAVEEVVIINLFIHLYKCLQ